MMIHFVLLACSFLQGNDEGNGLPTKLSASPTPQSSIAMSVVDTILEHHLSPPTRQQLVVEIIRTAAKLSRSPVPHSLALRVSQLPPKELEVFLSESLTEMNSRPSGVGIQRNSISWNRTLSISMLVSDITQRYNIALMSAEASTVNKQLAANRYVGIGIRLGQLQHPPCPAMQTVFPNGPASLAGAKDGDVIVEVDGNDTSGISMGQVVNWLRGPKGSPVTVKVVDKEYANTQSVVATDHVRTLEMTRGVVPIATLSEWAYSSDRKIAAIKLDRISASSVHELRKREATLPDETETVALDLQFTGDFDLHNGRLLANSLFDSGAIGSIQTDRGTQKLEAEPGRLFENRRLVLVIGPGTGGTAEWIAAAVADRKNGIIIGSPSDGNGYVTDSFHVDDSEFVITVPVGVLLRIDGRPLSRPDSTAVASRTQALIQILQSAPEGNGSILAKEAIRIAEQQFGIATDPKDSPRWRVTPDYSRPPGTPINLNQIPQVIQSMPASLFEQHLVDDDSGTEE